MRSRIEAVVLPAEPTEFRDDVRRIFREQSHDAIENEIDAFRVKLKQPFENDIASGGDAHAELSAGCATA